MIEIIANDEYTIIKFKDNTVMILKKGMNEVLYSFESLDELMTYLNEGYMKY